MRKSDLLKHDNVGCLEIKNSFGFEIKVSNIVDYEHPKCRLAQDGAPSVMILRPGESISVLNMEPGVSYYFEPVIIRDIQIARYKYRAAIDEVTIANS